jgi:hypothetical protein
MCGIRCQEQAVANSIQNGVGLHVEICHRHCVCYVTATGTVFIVSLMLHAHH